MRMPSQKVRVDSNAETHQLSDSYDLFVSYAEADRAWVEDYLLDALRQADVCYHSEQAFALGKPRLLEFEDAVEQSRRVLLVLSPAYLSDGFSIKPFADVFGFDRNAE